MQEAAQAPFRPLPAGQTIVAVSPTATLVPLIPVQTDVNEQVILQNSGATDAIVAFGYDNTVVASTSSGMLLRAGTSRALSRVLGQDFASLVTTSGSTTVFVEQGVGVMQQTDPAGRGGTGTGGGYTPPGTTAQLLDGSGIPVTVGANLSLNATTHTLSATGGGGGGGAGVPVTTVASSGASQALTMPGSGGKAYDITLTANCTLTLSGGAAGQQTSITLYLRQDATAGRTPTLPAGIVWPAGIPPTPNTTGGRVDVFTITTPDNGATYFGAY